MALQSIFFEASHRLARSEVERRVQYIEVLDVKVGPLHPGHSLIQLVKQSKVHHRVLAGETELRPTTDEVPGSLEGMRVEAKGEAGYE